MTMGPNVQRCGQPRRGEVNKETGERAGVGEPCGLPAGFKTGHLGRGACVWHDNPHWARRDADELAVREARTALARIGEARPLADVGEAYDSLLEVGGQLKALVGGLQDKVSALEEVALNHPIRGSMVKAELQAYLGAVRVLTETIRAISNLNVEERRTKIAERQAQLIERVFVLTFRELYETAADRERAQRVAGRHLAAVRALPPAQENE